MFKDCAVVLTILSLALGVANTPAKSANIEVGNAFRDCPDCPEMAPLPPGNYTMGVPVSEEDKERVPHTFRGRGAPQHVVTISRGFAIGKYDVTRGEFTAFVDDTGYKTSDGCYIYDRKTLRHSEGYSWRNVGFSQTDRHPVVCVSWEDAQAYLAWLSHKTGQAYRLPSEAEWEYAARAGSKLAHYWGNRPENACIYGNVSDLTFGRSFDVSATDAGPVVAQAPMQTRTFPCFDKYVYTSPVGTFQQNAFGLYDMLGNVWQWVEDCWNENYRGAPGDGSAWMTGRCRSHVLRGGSWFDDPSFVRLGNRNLDDIANRGTDVGFRVAKTLD